jgi:hypothetical protein
MDHGQSSVTGRLPPEVRATLAALSPSPGRLSADLLDDGGARQALHRRNVDHMPEVRDWRWTPWT